MSADVSFVRVDGGRWYADHNIIKKSDVQLVVTNVLPTSTDWHLEVMDVGVASICVNLTVYGAGIVAERMLGNNVLQTLQNEIRSRMPVSVKVDFNIEWKEARDENV
jgi:hypothetical protein